MKCIEQKEGVYTHFATTSLEKPAGYLLIELPHGSTTTNDFKWYQEKLQGDYPPNIIDFFYVNTDVGSPEIAFEIAQQLKENYEVHILRSHIPRTFIDCNRVVGEGISYSEGGVTPATPSYVTNKSDIEFLYASYHAYQNYVKGLYAKICGERAGLALMLHTYAPRSVPITKVDHDIVEQLHAFYDTEKIEDCKLRPEVDIIHKTPDGEVLIDKTMIQNITEQFESAGFDVQNGASYLLHPVTTAHYHAQQNHLQTLCLEVRRDLVVSTWSPFEEMNISKEKAQRIASCIAQAISTHS